MTPLVAKPWPFGVLQVVRYFKINLIYLMEIYVFSFPSAHDSKLTDSLDKLKAEGQDHT